MDIFWHCPLLICAMQVNLTTVIFTFCACSGGKGLSLNVNQLVNFLNQEQRDPRLNEILYPYYDKERALSLIWKYEKSLDNLQRGKVRAS